MTTHPLFLMAMMLLIIDLLICAATWQQVGTLTAEVSQITALLRQHVGG